MTRTPINVLISMIRPNKKGSKGARTAKMTKSAKNRDHGRLLQQCEKARSGRRSGDELVGLPRAPGILSIPETSPENVEGGHKTRGVTRASGQVA